jgi:hypothetical protein
LESYPTEEIQIELFPEIHEYGGMCRDGEVEKGLNNENIKNIIPNIIFPEGIDISQGWWKSDILESEEHFKERTKFAMLKLKELASKNEENYTICLISHSKIMSSILSFITNAEVLIYSN